MKTVLIVDDEPITRMDLRDMLTDLSFDVIGEAADGFDAIEFCRARRPDLVLMDVKMPIFDGLTASETILGEELAGCVVLLTAFGERDIIDQANRIGVTGYLVKPIEQRLLLPTVDSVTYDNGFTEEVHGFDVPVPALDEEFDLAILGKSGKWNDHKVVVTNPVPEA